MFTSNQTCAYALLALKGLIESGVLETNQSLDSVFRQMDFTVAEVICECRADFAEELAKELVISHK